MSSLTGSKIPCFENSESELEANYVSKKNDKENPLVDVKFYAGNTASCTRDEFCVEALAMEKAVAKGKTEELIFNDVTQ